MKKKTLKKNKTESNDTTILSIIIGASLIIISTLVYRFEIAGKTFYLRYFVTFIAAAVLFDALNLKFHKRILHTLKLITYIIVIFLCFMLVYVIMTLP